MSDPDTHEHTAPSDHSTTHGSDHGDDHGDDHGGHDHVDRQHGGQMAGHGHAGHGMTGHDMAGHDMAGMGSMADHFRRLFWQNLVLAIPVAVFSPMLQGWFGYSITFPGSAWVAPIFGTIVYFYGGQPFLTGAVSELKQRKPGMMMLISLAITTAYVASMLNSVGVLHDLDFWWELAGLIVIMLLGHWQEMKAVGQAQGALTALGKLLPDTAERLDADDKPHSVPMSDIRTGDRVLVRAGGRVPADGDITHGVASFDESMLTGESKPVAKKAGDKVVAGSISTNSSVTVHVTATGSDTELGGIRRLVEQAENSKSGTQALADRAAGLLFYVAVAAAVITFVVWVLVGNVNDAIARTVTVLVIACPHALGLAIPLVISISTAKAAQHGILVKDRMALENMRLVDTVLMDKTGTLTVGKPAVTEVTAADGDTATGSDNAADADGAADKVLALAAAVEANSEHPLAAAITTLASDKHLSLPTATDIETIPGKGVTANVDGATVAVGGPSMLADHDLQLSGKLADASQRAGDRGATTISVVDGDKVAGVIALQDEIRPESRAAVAALQARGRKVEMITGDAKSVADDVADELGIDEVFANVLPADKHRAVEKVQQRGEKVAMVGDGVNDAPALAQADVGLAIGAGTDVAIQSAGVVLASSDPRNVVGVIALSKASYAKMIQNLWWAVGYNVIAIPLAAGVLAPIGFIMPPAVGAIMMSLSTVIVAVNAETLRSLDLNPDHLAPAVSKRSGSGR